MNSLQKLNFLTTLVGLIENKIGLLIYSILIISLILIVLL